MFDSLRSTAKGIRRRSTVAALLVAMVAGSAPVAAEGAVPLQDRRAPPAIRPPEVLTTACEMKRTPLAVEVVANSMTHYPRHAERISSGWLIHERYDRQVVELDNDLREVARWGRKGPGPLEYRGRVLAFGRTDSGSTFVVDDSPPSVMVFGSTEEEYLLNVHRPHHAVNAGGRLLLASSLGIHEATISRDGAGERVWRHEDLEIDVSKEGKPSRYLLRSSGDGAVYAAATSQSAIWVLNGKGGPRKIVQRCVPRAWQEMHRRAPVFESGPFKGEKYSLRTLGDYAVLDEGRLLTLGTLHTNAQLHGSLELYNADGALVRAWELPLPSSARKVLDPYNPRRLLVWGPWKGEEHVRLIEVDGEGYPSS